ncbi:MAG: TlpA disulfide reductase family protein [Acidobacteriota bacterium]|nr:TlpA family protein disulfide reductase [Blastocatellia bacterium]MDW8413526.1 TlpA disulfide reductase family protein [Acidobacteriota bacterium]
MRVFALLALLLISLTVNAQHEYAPLEEKTVNYKNWTLKALDTDEQINLRDWAKGKKLVLVVYYAPWCRNWHLEAPVLARLYEKYKDKGFDVIAVNEYGSVEQAQEYFESIGGHSYKVVVESTDMGSRDKTSHFVYRQAVGDRRNWGSPFNVFLIPELMPLEGELLAEKAWIVAGELVEEEVDEFIRSKLKVE